MLLLSQKSKRWIDSKINRNYSGRQTKVKNMTKNDLSEKEKKRLIIIVV